MKRTLIIMLTAAILLMFCACGGTTPPEETDNTTAAPGTSSQTGGTGTEPGGTTVEGSPALPGTTASETEPPQPTNSNTTVTTTAATAEPPLSSETPVNLNGILLLGTTAMEHFYMSKAGMTAYAQNISKLKEKLPGVNVYAMFVPTSIEFNAPAKHKSGDSSQLEAMNFWYSQMAENVVSVDTWTEMYNHRTEYLYFRTDTHWAQRGAYYAYVAFAKAAGITPHAIGEYRTGLTYGYLGYLYTVTKSTVLYNNPDSVEYFMPINSSKMKAYQSSAMTNGISYPVVASPKANYYMFMAGDQPLCHIVSDTVKNGKKLIVTKDSYGNALIPFLTDHFEEIFVIDQRYFNRSNYPSLNIVSFAKDHGVTDILCEANAFNSVNGNVYFSKLLP